jgi:hypothetical protein
VSKGSVEREVVCLREYQIRFRGCVISGSYLIQWQWPRYGLAPVSAVLWHGARPVLLAGLNLGLRFRNGVGTTRMRGILEVPADGQGICNNCVIL